MGGCRLWAMLRIDCDLVRVQVDRRPCQQLGAPHRVSAECKLMGLGLWSSGCRFLCTWEPVYTYKFMDQNPYDLLL